MPAPAVVLTSPPVTLLTLTHAGKTWRLSSSPVDVEDNSGVMHLYRGGLSPIDVYADATMFGTSDPQSQTFEALFSADIASLSSEHHLPSEIHAEVALLFRGAKYDEARVMLSGQAKVESSGFEGKPLRITVTADDPAENPSVYPTLTQQINSDTWGDSTGNRYYDTPAEAKSYPQAIGNAGQEWINGSFVDLPAIPAHSVGFNTGIQGRIAYSPFGRVADWAVPPFGAAPYKFALISSGFVYPGDGANKGRVTAFQDMGAGVPPETLTCSMHYFTDALGQVVTLLWAHEGAGEVFSTSTKSFEPGGTYYVALPRPNSGIARPDYRGGISGGGSVVRWALEKTDVRVDWRRTTPALAILDRYELAGFWDQPCDPWSWLVDNVFPLLPCSWVAGPNGVYPVVWRLDATQHNADAALTDGLDCTISGPVKSDGIGQSSRGIEYAPGLVKVAYRRRAEWHGKATRETNRESTSLHTRRAQLRYGSRRGSEYLQRAESLETDLIYADSTADMSLAWQSRFHSQPRQTLRVISDGLHHRSKVAQLEPGMAVALTSDRYSFESRVAYVTRAGWLGGVCYADLVILSAP